MARSVPSTAKPSGDRLRSARPSDEGPSAGPRQTRRWRGITGVTLLALGVGLLAEESALLLASVVGVAFSAYGGLARPTEPTLDVRRTIEAIDPDPGDTVSVTVTVENAADRTLLDLRLIDGVPGGLTVVDGAPRLGTALRPGERATFDYDVEIRRGSHEFDELTAIARDPAGATEYVATVAEPDTIDCVPPFDADPPRFPLRPQTTRFTGRTTSKEGGSGVEFHATREYRAGDPINRIDWRRTARTGDLTTVEYDREQSAAVLLVIDARSEAAVAPAPHESSAIERSVQAAHEVAGSLLAAGHTVGVATIAPTSSWLAPDRGAEHRVAIRRLLAGADGLQRTAPEEDVNVYAAVRSIRQRAASDVQVLFLSPLADDPGADAALRFEAHGHATTVVSPDASAGETVGQTLASLQRDVRVGRLRRSGVPVIDLEPGESMERALARARTRRAA